VREAALQRREECVAAREAEVRRHRSPTWLWWALRLAPWTAVELLAGIWLVVAAVLGVAVIASAVVVGVFGALIALARLSGGFGP
jgi:hypothetical protein